MLQRSSLTTRLCYERAAEARQRAKEARAEQERAEYLSIEGQWLKLAASYEFSERVGRFLDSHPPRRHGGKWQIGQRVSRAGFDELGTIVEVADKIKVKWDRGRTSYYTRAQAANMQAVESDR